jgi:NADH:ubiquinone oxidoreductase subunit 2 (subunit N)
MSFLREGVLRRVRLSLCVLPRVAERGSKRNAWEPRRREVRALVVLVLGLGVERQHQSSWLPLVLFTRRVWLRLSHPVARGWVEQSRGLVFYLLGRRLLVTCRSRRGEGLILGWFGLELQAFRRYLLIRQHTKSVSRTERGLQFLLLSRGGSALVLLSLHRALLTTGTWRIHGALSTRLLLCGVCFKLGTRPFHVWTLLVFTRRSTFLRGFLASLGKLARFDFLVRIGGLRVTRGRRTRPTYLLGTLRRRSLAVGSFGAVGETNLYRLMRYSGVRHRGFLLLRVLRGSPLRGGRYGLLYRRGRGLVWHLLQSAPHRASLTAMAETRSLSRKRLLTVRIRSLAGFPPFLGFGRKAQAFLARVQTLDTVFGRRILAIILVSAMVGFLYSLNLLRVLWFPERLGLVQQSPRSHSKAEVQRLGSGQLTRRSRRVVFPLAVFLVAGLFTGQGQWLFLGLGH